MRNLIAFVTLLVGGVTQLPTISRIDHTASVLVSDPSPSPFGNEYEPVPTPEPDFAIEQSLAPTPLASPATDELKRLAEQLRQDAAKIQARADELKPLTASMQAKWMGDETDSEKIDDILDGVNAIKAAIDGGLKSAGGESLDEAAMRKIVSDEIIGALAFNPRVGNGSNGGTVKSGGSSGYSSVPLVSSSYSQPYSSPSWSPPVQSSHSAGGSVSATAFSPPSSVVHTQPNLRDRIASRLATPFDSLAGSKVTIHKYASKKYCGACDGWMKNVAPRLQADQALVTEIYDLPDDAMAPVIDVCRDSLSCQSVVGAASYAQIVGMLRPSPASRWSRNGSGK